MSTAPAIRAGAIVAWWDAGALRFAIVGGEEKQRIRLVLAGGKEERVKATRVATEVEGPGSVPAPTLEARRSAGERVRRFEEEARSRAASIDVGLVWEVVTEEPDRSTTFALDELAALALDESSGEQVAALLLALVEDGLHFVRRGDAWEARSRETVADLERQREAMARRKAETEAVFTSLRAAVRGEAYAAVDGELERRVLDALEEVAVSDEDASRSAQELAAETLRAAGLRWDRLGEGAFRLLRLVGRIASDDENLQIRRFRLRAAFSDPLEHHARQLAVAGFDRVARVDLTDLLAVSIDSPSTVEIDDALSVEPLAAGGFRLGIHIADPGAFLAPGDPVDVEAAARGVTHYFPERRITMLPAVLAEQAASLVSGVDRPALSFLVELDDEGRIRGTRIVRSIVRATSRLSYADVDRTVQSGQGAHVELLSGLAAWGERREGLRCRGGAILLHSEEVDVHVDAAGGVRLERNDSESPSRRAVTEAMVLAGEVAAAFAVAEGIPLMFRRQAPPASAFDPPAEPLRDPVAIRQMRRRLKRSEISLHPAGHCALGLDAYTQVTSPLRRFQDLVNARQIAAHVSDEPLPYDSADLERIAATTERAEGDARRAERAQNEFWLLRYLEGRTGKIVVGHVVELEPRPVVRLAEALREQPLPSLTGVALGQEVRLEIQRVNPRAGLLVLRHVRD